MRRLAVGLLIFMTGWGLGWFASHHGDTKPGQPAQPVRPAASTPADPETAAVVPVPAAPGDGDNITRLLNRNEFTAAVERYESVQARAGTLAVAEAKTLILSHARRLVAGQRFSLAEQLLQEFLVAAYRDVEARLLLAAAYRGQQDFNAAIEQLYEARGYAWRPLVLQRISGRIRSIVGEQTQLLKRNDDQNGLLALYQQLIQLEPDHAPWFMELAATQLALDDSEAARRSLLLVSQDPDVGAQAQAMLSALNLAQAGLQDTQSLGPARDVVGIPLHRSGNHFVVDARPAGGRGMRLLIDTGASLTILAPAVLAQRGIRYQDTGRSGVFNTANGPVRAPIHKLDALEVGDWHVDHLEIGVLDLGGRSGVDGLLGMNFLRHFQFFIDQNEAVLRLAAQ